MIPSLTRSTAPRRHRLAALVAALCVLALLASCTDSTEDGAAAGTTEVTAAGVAQEAMASVDTSTPSILFSLETPTATITDIDDTQRLTIATDETVTWFTDRPDRTAGSSTLTDFIAVWAGNAFDTDPPNAALITHTIDPATGTVLTRTHVVELSDPRIDGATTSFVIVDVPGDPAAPTGAASHAGRSATHPVETGSYGLTELFIDSTSYPPCPSRIVDSSSSGCMTAGTTIAWSGGEYWNMIICSPAVDFEDTRYTLSDASGPIGGDSTPWSCELPFDSFDTYILVDGMEWTLKVQDISTTTSTTALNCLKASECPPLARYVLVYSIYFNPYPPSPTTTTSSTTTTTLRTAGGSQVRPL